MKNFNTNKIWDVKLDTNRIFFFEINKIYDFNILFSHVNELSLTRT